MIATLRGMVTDLDPRGVVVDVHGVGYFVNVPTRTAASLRLGEETLLYTRLVVREDDMSLYGFTVPDERSMFDLLCGVTGVGPKSALGVLSDLSVSEISRAVVAEDDAVFRKVSGIGPKTAKLLCLTLQGKVTGLHGGDDVPPPPVEGLLSPSDRRAILDALTGLGWSERVAVRGLEEAVAQHPEGQVPEVGTLIRSALRILGPRTVREDSR